MLKTNNIEDTGNAPQIPHPYCGEGFKDRLAKVELRTIEKEDTGEKWENVLSFRFKVGGKDITGKDVSGYEMEKAEWPIREDDDSKKIQNKLDRIGYIAKYFIGEEAASELSGEDWNDYAKNVVAAFEKVEYSKVPINLKVPADDYNGLSLEIPNYKGFIQGKNSKKPIDFTPSEKEVNKKFMRQANESPDSSDEILGGDQEVDIQEEDPF